jgi:hypothetical protein
MRPESLRTGSDHAGADAERVGHEGLGRLERVNVEGEGVPGDALELHGGVVSRGRSKRSGGRAGIQRESAGTVLAVDGKRPGVGRP